MQKEIPHRNNNQKNRRNDVCLEATKPKRKSIGDIHDHHQHQAHLTRILMRVKIEELKTRKTQILGLG